LGVEGDEDLVHLLSGLIVRWPAGHHLEELVELNLSTAVLVQLGDHLVDCLGLGLNTERVNGNLEFWDKSACTLGVDGSSQISVEEVEGLLDFQDLFDGDVG
jgi:hypothetical protein